VTKTQSVGPISCLEHRATRVLHCAIVTRAAVLMFPLSLQTIISNQMRTRRLMGNFLPTQQILWRFLDSGGDMTPKLNSKQRPLAEEFYSRFQFRHRNFLCVIVQNFSQTTHRPMTVSTKPRPFPFRWTSKMAEPYFRSRIWWRGFEFPSNHASISASFGDIRDSNYGYGVAAIFVAWWKLWGRWNGGGGALE